MKPIITKPTNMYLNNGYYNHCGDTFREVIDLWEELELVDVTHSSTTPFCWWGGVGNVLLYDRPNLEWLKGWSDYQVGLFGNPVPPENGSMNMKWIFWGRNPRKLHEFNMEKSYKTYEERKITSIFLGKIENHIQNDFRDCSTWESTIEVFNCNKDYTSGTWKYSHDEYLEMLSNSKYGLCLRGYGPKCNREIELMSMGVVPLITPNVDIILKFLIQMMLHKWLITQARNIGMLCLKPVKSGIWTIVLHKVLLKLQMKLLKDIKNHLLFVVYVL
jgi:hypothetical protein